MVRAHSLLYAIYVCLIISLLCGALLYIANLYNQLNLYYVTHEELYIHNQSMVNYAMANIATPENVLSQNDDENAIQTLINSRSYGVLNLLVVSSFVKNDTVVSAHLAGITAKDKNCVYLTNFDRPLSYSGTVKLMGDKKLPSDFIKTIHIENKANTLDGSGTISVSDKKLPELSKNIEKGICMTGIRVKLKDLPKNDSGYYNSFFRPSLEVELEDHTLMNIAIKGNIIIRSNDSITVTSSALLEDVILIAPKIIFDNNFTGNLQVFATKKIEVGNSVKLKYPSVLCLNNTSIESGTIHINENSSICGAVILFGNPNEKIENNSIEIEKEALIVCDIYCTGKLTLKSNVYGSVYTNKFVHKTASSGYDNCLADVEINPYKRPVHMVCVPLLDNNKSYGAIKKVM